MGKRTIDLLFTLYGDYIRHRGGEAWIGSLIQLLGCLGVSAQAVRSTTARLTRHGWLAHRREGRHGFYSITAKMSALLAEGAQRIYVRPTEEWDRHWFIVDYSLGESQRRERDRLRSKLLWLGFGQLSGGTWISPHDSRAEVTRLCWELGLEGQVTCFRAELLECLDGSGFLSRCWDLPGLAAAYRQFLGKHSPRYEFALWAEQNGKGLSPKECFVRRFWLVHEFRRFPYRDPHLPAHLLPKEWPGEKAEALFEAYQGLLTAEASEFVDTVMSTAFRKEAVSVAL